MIYLSERKDIIMPKVKALNRNGEITWCTAKTPGHGNCNHVLHQTGDMTER